MFQLPSGDGCTVGFEVSGAILDPILEGFVFQWPKRVRVPWSQATSSATTMKPTSMFFS